MRPTQQYKTYSLGDPQNGYIVTEMALQRRRAIFVELKQVLPTSNKAPTPQALLLRHDLLMGALELLGPDFKGRYRGFLSNPTLFGEVMALENGSQDSNIFQKIFCTQDFYNQIEVVRGVLVSALDGQDSDQLAPMRAAADDKGESVAAAKLSTLYSEAVDCARRYVHRHIVLLQSLHTANSDSPIARPLSEYQQHLANYAARIDDVERMVANTDAPDIGWLNLKHSLPAMDPNRVIETIMAINFRSDKGSLFKRRQVRNIVDNVYLVLMKSIAAKVNDFTRETGRTSQLFARFMVAFIDRLFTHNHQHVLPELMLTMLSDEEATSNRYLETVFYKNELKDNLGMLIFGANELRTPFSRVAQSDEFVNINNAVLLRFGFNLVKLGDDNPLPSRYAYFGLAPIDELPVSLQMLLIHPVRHLESQITRCLSDGETLTTSLMQAYLTEVEQYEQYNVEGWEAKETLENMRTNLERYGVSEPQSPSNAAYNLLCHALAEEITPEPIDDDGAPEPEPTDELAHHTAVLKQTLVGNPHDILTPVSKFIACYMAHADESKQALVPSHINARAVELLQAFPKAELSDKNSRVFKGYARIFRALIEHADISTLLEHCYNSAGNGLLGILIDAADVKSNTRFVVQAKRAPHRVMPFAHLIKMRLISDAAMFYQEYIGGKAPASMFSDALEKRSSHKLAIALNDHNSKYGHGETRSMTLLAKVVGAKTRGQLDKLVSSIDSMIQSDVAALVKLQGADADSDSRTSLRASTGA